MNAFTPAWYISLITAEKENLTDLYNNGTITKQELTTAIDSLNRIQRTIEDFVNFTKRINTQ